MAYRDNFSLLIPTKDRQDILASTLSLYNHMESPFRFLIVDASATPNETLERDYPKLKISYTHLPNSSVFEAIQTALANCSTSFCTFCGDDDVVLTEGAEKCIEQLLDDQSISICSGHAMFIYYEKKHQGEGFIHSKPRGWYTPNWRSLYDPKSEERFNRFKDNYQVLQYGVTRTAIATLAYSKQLIPLDKINRNLPEIAVCSALAYLGTVKIIENVWLLRGVGVHRELNAQVAKANTNFNQATKENTKSHLRQYFLQVTNDTSLTQLMTNWAFERALLPFENTKAKKNWVHRFKFIRLLMLAFKPKLAVHMLRLALK
ncbi:TIGR00180 family glycosyltransferase [bacterium]|nr:TIGR00180 family glycosyltransferase [bacterium]